ncbi:MAG TPA: DUF423 domain-containing protein [Cyclobacteriaceae bacterium]|nr:DUF423 domain-containing protein [Cyclobacteriaceae bacterium]
MNQKQTLLCGAALGLLGVALGAFGAHALKPMLVGNGRLETFKLAVQYQFYHAFALLFTGMLVEKLGLPILRWSSLLFFGGVILFSGSLYLFAVTNIGTFAIVTPLGGLLLLAGWSILAYAIAMKI